MNRDKARVAIYALAGVYLLYLAWQLFSGLETAGSEKPLMIIFMIAFALIGAGAVIWGIYTTWKQFKDPSGTQEQEEAASEEEQENEK